MIKIKVWCLPKPSEAALKRLYEDLARAMGSVPEVSKETLLVLFPADLMKFDLGKEIYVEVVGVRGSRNAKSATEVRNRVANHVGRAVKEHFPDAEIEVDVPLTRQSDGYWAYKPEPKAA